mmetsp:Transcript_74705/g.211351  ORF Transcript_74705/g.211351 Transcript_74705/m.211351 type:complete len:403 (-) Transcript_74705:971-2179(-)
MQRSTQVQSARLATTTGPPPVHARAKGRRGSLDDEAVDAHGGGVHDGAGAAHAHAPVPAVDEALHLLVRNLELDVHELFQLHESPLLLQPVLVRFLDDLLLLAQLAALLVEAADLGHVLFREGRVLGRVPLLLPEAARLLVRPLELGLRAAELHVELVVALLGLEHVALELLDLARDLAQLPVHSGLGLVVGGLLLQVLDLDLLEVLAHRAEGLDLGRELVLLLLELRVDLGDDGGDLVQGLALGLVHVRLVHGGLLEHGLGLTHARRRGVLGLQDLLRALEHCDLVPQLAELRLQALELRRLVAQRRGVVLELVALHEFVALHLLVLALLHREILGEVVAVLLEVLLVLQDHLLLLRDQGGLLLVHGEPRVLVVLVDLLLEALDLRLHGADLALHVLDVHL